MKFFFIISFFFFYENVFTQRYFYGDSTIEYNGNIRIEKGYIKDSIYMFLSKKVEVYEPVNDMLITIETDNNKKKGYMYIYKNDSILITKITLKDRIANGKTWCYDKTSGGTIWIEELYFHNGKPRRVGITYNLWDSVELCKRQDKMNKEYTATVKVRNIYCKPLYKIHYTRDLPLEFQVLVITAKKKYKLMRRKK